MIKKYSAQLIGLVTIASRLLSLLILGTPNSFNQFEAAELHSRALAYAQGVSFPYATVWGSYHVPLGIFYKFLLTLGLGEHLLIGNFVLNIILSAISAYLVYRIAQSVFPRSPRFSLGIALAFVLYYPLIYLNALVMSENLFVPLILGIVYLSVRKTVNSKPSPPKLQRRWGYTVNSILLALALVTRPIILIFIPLYLLWLWYYRKKHLPRKSLGLAVIIFIGVISSVSLLNGKFDPTIGNNISSNGGGNFILTWCQPRRVTMQANGEQGYWFSPPVYYGKDPTTDMVVEQQVSDTFSLIKIGIHCALENPSRIVTNISNIRYLFDSSMHPNMLTAAPLHNELLVVWHFITIILGVAFWVYPFIMKKVTASWSLAALLLGSLFLSVYLFNPGEERYLVPYFFVILIWGGWVVKHLFAVIINKLKRLSDRELLKIWAGTILISIPFLLYFGFAFITALNHTRAPLQFYIQPTKTEVQDAYVKVNSFLAKQTKSIDSTNKNSSETDLIIRSKELATCLAKVKPEPCVEEFAPTINELLTIQRHESNYDYLLGSFAGYEDSDQAALFTNIFIKLGKSDSDLKTELNQAADYGVFNLLHLQIPAGLEQGAIIKNKVEARVYMPGTLAVKEMFGEYINAVDSKR